MLALAYFLELLQRVLKNSKLAMFLRVLWRNLKPELFIRLFYQMNFTLTVCSYLQILFITEFTSWVDVFSSVLGVLCAALCLVFPVISIYILYNLKSQNLLHDKKIIDKYGALY